MQAENAQNLHLANLTLSKVVTTFHTVSKQTLYNIPSLTPCHEHTIQSSSGGGGGGSLDDSDGAALALLHSMQVLSLASYRCCFTPCCLQLCTDCASSSSFREPAPFYPYHHPASLSPSILLVTNHRQGSPLSMQPPHCVSTAASGNNKGSSATEILLHIFITASRLLPGIHSHM